MRNLFSKIKYKLASCYGNDELNRFLSILAIVFCFLSFIPYLYFFLVLALALIIFTTYRSFSKNYYKRRAENEKFLSIGRKFKKRRAFKKLVKREKKDFLYFKCPKCKQYLRVPRGRGNIVVTCRVCGAKTDKKT